MKHVTANEMVLYLGNLGIEPEEKDRITDHFLNCEMCHEKFSEIKKKYQGMLSQNFHDCTGFTRQMLAYIDGRLAAAKKKELAQHLEECDGCRQFYRWLIEIPELEKITVDSEKLTPTKMQRIEQRVIQQLARLAQNKADPNRSPRPLSEKIEKTVYALKLIFQALQPAQIFRDIGLDHLKIIDHPGGDLELHTGISQVKIELNSVFEEEVLLSETDTSGIAIFPGLKKGDYWVSVDGYDLVDFWEIV